MPFVVDDDDDGDLALVRLSSDVSEIKLFLPRPELNIPVRPIARWRPRGIARR
jgi:hypothetical protein